MTKKFIQPVSMQVTKEQFEKDLKKPLEEMEYEIADELFSFESFPFITTNYDENNISVKNTNEIDAKKHERHYIDHYNPQLFLALAAMTNEKYGIKGEWWVRTDDDSHYYTKGKLYKQYKNAHKGEIVLDDNDNKNDHRWDDYLLVKKFRKATKEELIAHFTEELPKDWYIEITEENLELVKEWRRLNNSSSQFSDGELLRPMLLLSKHIKDETYLSYVSLKRFKADMREDRYKNHKEITTSQLKQIIKMSCDSWKKRLSRAWGSELLLNGDVEISKDLYDEGYKAANSEQKEVLNEIFGKPVEDSHPFTKEFYTYDTEDMNRKFFNGEEVLQIATSVAREIKRPDLDGKAFYVTTGYEVKLHIVPETGTVIEIQKR